MVFIVNLKKMSIKFHQRKSMVEFFNMYHWRVPVPPLLQHPLIFAEKLSVPTQIGIGR